MKRILFLILCSIIIIGVASAQSGTKVTSSLVPNSELDNYPTHQAKYGKGGFRTVKTLTQRDAILTSRRDTGMLVYVIQDSTIYQLKGGLLNVNWKKLNLSGNTDTTVYTLNNQAITTAGYTYTFRSGGTNTNYSVFTSTYDNIGNPVDSRFTKQNNSVIIYPAVNCNLDITIIKNTGFGGLSIGGTSTWANDSSNYAAKSYVKKAIHDSLINHPGGLALSDSTKKYVTPKQLKDTSIVLRQKIDANTSALAGKATNQAIHDSVVFIKPIKIAYDTIVRFNNICTDYATHTLTHNDSLVIQTSDALDNGGAQILFVNNGIFKPRLGAFKQDTKNSFYDPTATYTLLTFLRKRGIYFVSIYNVY